ncbi:MAG: tetratricopeptide repeat protein [Saprospiraceae bacterium]|nr:tetratricopeptide repeat protein [Saprospiraceae bacterium]
MARRKQKKSDETLVDIVEAKEQAQDFFERNQLLVLGVLAAVVLVIGGLFAYHNLYKKPRNQQAMEQMFQAQFQFERDSFALALDAPGGGYDGFLDIIDNYSGTQAANLAHYYAGICYLNLGRYEAAADFLRNFKADGQVTPIMKFGALGDALSELEDWDGAITNYRKAVDAADNDLLTPFYLKKLGMLYERQGQPDRAREMYQRIKDEYPNSTIGQDIDKYLSAVAAK